MLVAMPKPLNCNSVVRLEMRIQRVNRAMGTLIRRITRVVEKKNLFFRLVFCSREISRSTI